MALKGLLGKRYVQFDEKSNFKNESKEFKNGKYPVHLEAYFEEQQLINFAKELKNIKELHYS